MSNAEGIGVFLRRWREGSGRSLGELARSAGVSKSTLSTWERGLRQPCLPELEAVLDVLGATGEERTTALGLIDAPRARRALADADGPGFRPALMAALRARTGMDQSDMATALGVRQSSVSRWEGGDAEPSVETLRRFARLAGATPNEWTALTRPAPQGDGGSLDTIEARFWWTAFDAPMPKDVEFLLLRRALARTDDAKGRQLRARVAIRHAQCLAECGRAREATSAALDAIVLGRKEGLTEGSLLPAAIAEAAVTRSPERALRVLAPFENAVADPLLRSWLADERGQHLARAGRLDAGVASVRDGMAIAQAEGRPGERYLRHRGAARVLVRAGRLDEAARALEFVRPPDLIPTTLDHVAAYEIARANGDDSAADAHRARAAERARQEGRILALILGEGLAPSERRAYSAASATASFQSFEYPSP